MGFLPDVKQIGVALKGRKLNIKQLDKRKEVVATAKTFRDTIQLQKGAYKDVAFNPDNQEGVIYITGGARVALLVMYGLYMRAPSLLDIDKSIDWVLDRTPDILAAREWDLGAGKKNTRRVGEVSQDAYQLAVMYFGASMKCANRKYQEAQQASRRAAGYRSVSRNFGKGGSLTQEQRTALGRAWEAVAMA